MLKESCRIEVFADKLRRRSEESTGNAQKNSGALPQQVTADAVSHIAEAIAKENGLWIDFHNITSLGTPLPSGVENDVYLSANGYWVYKVNNLMTSINLLKLFDRLILHNTIFPQTAYELQGFTGFGNGSIYPILRQNFIVYDREATPIEIDTYMSALGFEKVEDTKYTKDNIEVSDLHPRNVLKDIDGDIFVVDAEFRQI
ncbi:MAG: hypothetical protein J1F40_03165 [Prevotellaceae bacterium]|nr:hypothetical protein [Prevotellaceae bacterium]